MNVSTRVLFSLRNTMCDDTTAYLCSKTGRQDAAKMQKMWHITEKEKIKKWCSNGKARSMRERKDV